VRIHEELASPLVRAVEEGRIKEEERKKIAGLDKKGRPRFS